MSDSFRCDSGVPGDLMPGGALADLPKLVSDVCFYSCFVSILYELAINKYSSIGENLSSATASLVATARYMLDEGIGEDSAIASMMEALMDALQDAGQNIAGAAVNTWSSFTDGFWAFAKGILFRSFGPIFLASIQYMMNKQVEILTNRSNMLGEIEVKLDDLTVAMNRLTGYDWWEDFVHSVLLASRYVNLAAKEVGQAYNSFLNNKWDSGHLSTAQEQMMSAWRLLSSHDAISTLLTELGESLGKSKPFDGSFIDKEWQEFCDDMDDVVRIIGELKEMYDCLLITSANAELYQALLIMAAATLKSLSESNGEALNLSMFPDVHIGQASLKDIYDGLMKTYLEMQDVVENERRTFAPLYNSTWRTKLRGYVLMLVGIGYLPEEWGLPTPMLGFESAGALQSANSLVQYIVMPHSPDDRVKSLSEYSFGSGEVGRKLKEFIIVIGSITDMLANHSQWTRRMQDLKNGIKNMKNHDMQAVAICDQYKDYGNSDFDYLLDMFESMGWTTAVKYLQSGKIQQLLGLSASGLVMEMTLADCVGSMIGGMEDVGISAKVAELTQNITSEARVTGRSSLSLPSFQFQALAGIQSRLNDAATEITDILDLEDVVCG